MSEAVNPKESLKTDSTLILSPTLSAAFDNVKNRYSVCVKESVPGEVEFMVDTRSDTKAAHELLSELQNRGYVHLADLTAYDEYPKSPRFYVYYALISLKEKKRCSVVAILNEENPAIATVTDLWKGANWLERETFDMYGIQFEGHPDHRRILLPPSFKGYPLRKDFVVDYRQEFEKTTAPEKTFDPFGSTIVRGGKT